jgi:hypothetical protein
MTVAYADPPYIGQAKRHYSDDENAPEGGAREVNHRVLVGTLVQHYDAWALSMSAAMYSLQEVVPLLPAECRMGAWVKPFASFKPNVDPAYTWEPVAFYSPRDSAGSDTARDHLSESITMGRGTHGAKPDAFCYWLFDLLGMTAEDGFHDLFPGSGAVSEAWDKWRRARRSEHPEQSLFA